MALINCPECNKEISDKSVNCINCGYPLQMNQKSSVSDERCNPEFVVSKYSIGKPKQKSPTISLMVESLFGTLPIEPTKVTLIDEKYNTLLEIVPFEYKHSMTQSKYHIIVFDRSEVEDQILETCKYVISCNCENNSHNIEHIIHSACKESLIPECPKCGSSHIQAVPRKWSFMTGILTNKVDRVCLSCGNKF